MIDRLYGKTHGLTRVPYRLCEKELSRRIPENIHRTGIGKQPGVWFAESFSIRGVSPGTDPGFSQIVPRRPHKVAAEPRKLFHHAPVLYNVLRERLTPHHQAVRMKLPFPLIPS